MKKRWPTVDADIHSRVTPEIRMALERIAKREKCSLSALIRGVMEEFVEKEKKRRGKL